MVRDMCEILSVGILCLAGGRARECGGRAYVCHVRKRSAAMGGGGVAPWWICIAVQFAWSAEAGSGREQRRHERGEYWFGYHEG